MRTRQFEVPKELLGEFFTQVKESELEAELIQLNEDDELEVEISYDDDTRDEVMSLIEIIDDYNS